MFFSKSRLHSPWEIRCKGWEDKYDKWAGGKEIWQMAEVIC